VVVTSSASSVGVSDSCSRGVAVTELRALAKDDRLRGRSEQLRKLARDLKAEKDLERWAQVDLFSAFLRADTIESAPRSAQRRWADTVLDLLPTTLVFLPIVVTWFGLYHATAAYRQSRGDPDLAGKSFLEQWQTGFDHRLAEWLYFDRIAFMTLLCVCALITASVSQAILRRRADQDAAESHSQLTRRLAAALTAADFQLSRFRLNDSSRLSEASKQLAATADQVGEATTAMREVQGEATKGLQQTKRTLEQTKQLAEAMLQGESALRAAAKEVEQASAGINSRLDEVSSALKDSGAVIRDAFSDWRVEGQLYSHRHEATADQVGVILSSVEGLLDRTSVALGELPATVDKFERHTSQATKQLEHGLSAGMDRFRSDVNVILSGLPDGPSGSEELVEQLQSLQQSIEGLRSQLGERRRWSRWSRGRRSE